jgi:hypothetical protein
VPAPAASVPCCKDDPVLGPFFKMLRLGMPPPAVKAKMAAAGLDSALLDLSPDAPSPLPQQKHQSVVAAAPAAPGAGAASALLAGISGFDKAHGLKHAAVAPKDAAPAPAAPAAAVCSKPAAGVLPHSAVAVPVPIPTRSAPATPPGGQAPRAQAEPLHGAPGAGASSSSSAAAAAAQHKQSPQQHASPPQSQPATPIAVAAAAAAGGGGGGLPRVSSLSTVFQQQQKGRSPPQTVQSSAPVPATATAGSAATSMATPAAAVGAVAGEFEGVVCVARRPSFMKPPASFLPAHRCPKGTRAGTCCFRALLQG